MKYRKKYRNFLRPNEKHRRGDIKVVHDESSRLFPRQHLTFHPFLVPCASIKIPELLLAISTEFMGSTILFISRPSSSLHSLSLPSSFFFFFLPSSSPFTSFSFRSFFLFFFSLFFFLSLLLITLYSSFTPFFPLLHPHPSFFISFLLYSPLFFTNPDTLLSSLLLSKRVQFWGETFNSRFIDRGKRGGDG